MSKKYCTSLPVDFGGKVLALLTSAIRLSSFASNLVTASLRPEFWTKLQTIILSYALGVYGACLSLADLAVFTAISTSTIALVKQDASNKLILRIRSDCFLHKFFDQSALVMKSELKLLVLGFK